VTPEAIVPEPYLLGYYAILRSVPNKSLGIVAMLVGIGMLYVIPTRNRSIIQSNKFKP
jgi:ubiquinol-cytochrome c reductase cytochrome b/c1 subunit